ncbi:MAG: DUF1425 domain-containing protein [Verrucomicrobiae bacterium]|nr:DUF1425 domain-containing protein [Verrucomicrobiae bacterium]
MRCYSIAGAILIAVMAAGCISSAPTTVEKSGGEYKVIANSMLLNNHIRVLERSTRRVNGLLEAQVRGLNIKGKDVQFEYRFVWLDQDGIRLDTEMTTWKPLALHAKEVAFMTGIAPTPEATDFLMAVRFAHQSTRW